MKKEEGIILSSSKTLCSFDEPIECKLVSGTSACDQLFRDVLTVRHLTDEKWPDQRTEADSYSQHYCMYVEDEPVGCLSVTRARLGPIFLQEYYPSVLVREFRNQLCSAYRFRIRNEYRRSSLSTKGLSLAATMIREAWREHLSWGIEIDMVNVEYGYIPYYLRLGYVKCEGCDFLCPVFKEPIAVMFLSTDPNRRSVISDLVRQRSTALKTEKVLFYLGGEISTAVVASTGRLLRTSSGSFSQR